MADETDEFPAIDLSPESRAHRTSDQGVTFGTSRLAGQLATLFETSPPELPTSDGQVNFSAFVAPALFAHETQVDYERLLEILRQRVPSARVSFQFDSSTGDSLADFAKLLLGSTSSWPELRGVQHYVDIRRFQSEEEKGFKLTSVELRVPGLPRSLQFELWERFARVAEAARREISSKLGSSVEGRAFRRVASSFTIGVVPW